jgi:hypothetical protein
MVGSYTDGDKVIRIADKSNLDFKRTPSEEIDGYVQFFI